MSSSQYQENDKKDVSMETIGIKANIGFLGPSLFPIGVCSISNC